MAGGEGVDAERGGGEGEGDRERIVGISSAGELDACGGGAGERMQGLAGSAVLVARAGELRDCARGELEPAGTYAYHVCHRTLGLWRSLDQAASLQRTRTSLCIIFPM